MFRRYKLNMILGSLQSTARGKRHEIFQNLVEKYIFKPYTQGHNKALNGGRGGGVYS